MAPIGTAQISGKANAGPAEVELNTLALRRVIRPTDCTVYGSYSGAAFQNIVVPTLGATFTLSGTGLHLAIFLWPRAASVAIVKKATVSMMRYGTVNAAGFFNLQLSRVIQDQGATIIAGDVITPPSTHTTLNAVTITPSNLRTNQPTSGAWFAIAPTSSAHVGNLRFVDSANVATVLQPVTRGDPNPVAAQGANLTTTAGTGIGPVALWDTAAGNYPIVLQQNQGLVFDLTATGVVIGTAENIDFGVSMQWDEANINNVAY